MNLRSWLRGVLASVAVALPVAACANGETAPPPETAGAYWANSPPVCGADEAREYFCDALLPRGSVIDRDDPYEHCPATLEGHSGVLDPTPPVAVFDADYTKYMRKRAAPGHECCYSWCSLIRVVPPPPIRACGPVEFREHFCFDALENGTSQPSGNYRECPAGIGPPEGAVFHAPPAAAFDPGHTAQKRSKGFNECCYSWCSKAPAGSGMHQRQK